MVLIDKRKGQAAIEFLMTYGWMLLVVLIVGALIFSFVDFGSLLPNKLDLSNNLKGSPSDSVAYSDDSVNTINRDEVKLVFSYIGARPVSIKPNAGVIVNNLGKRCLSYNITNLDTGSTSGCGPNDGACTNVTLRTKNSITFLNGQIGIMSFVCDNGVSPKVAPNTYKLIKNDVLEGTVTIKVHNPKTGLSIPSSGPIRLTIAQ